MLILLFFGLKGAGRYSRGVFSESNVTPLVKRGIRYNSMIGRRAKSAFHRAFFLFSLLEIITI